MPMQENIICDRCKTNLAAHTVSRGEVIEHLCCVCHIADGGSPADWHPVCMSEYAKKIPVSKFKKGDRVRVIKYGHVLWSNKKVEGVGRYNLPVIAAGETSTFYDMSAGLVGKEGVVEEASFNSVWIYAVSGIPSKYAWYDEQQLELI